MTDTITLTGLVATLPKHLTTGEGLPITSFRLASSQSRYDRATSAWVETGTNWYTITTFRRLALGAAASIKKGDRIVVTGRLRIRDWNSNDRNGTTIEVDADALGHDLTWGTSIFSRNLAASTQSGEAEQNDPGDAPDADHDDVGESASGAVATSSEADGFPVTLDNATAPSPAPSPVSARAAAEKSERKAADERVSVDAPF